MKSIVIVSLSLLGLVSTASSPFDTLKNEIARDFHKFNFANSETLSESVVHNFEKFFAAVPKFAQANGKAGEDYHPKIWETIFEVKAAMMKKAEEPGLSNDNITAVQKKKAIEGMFQNMEKDLEGVILH